MIDMATGACLKASNYTSGSGSLRTKVLIRQYCFSTLPFSRNFVMLLPIAEVNMQI